jgi:hypothetical protein
VERFAALNPQSPRATLGSLGERAEGVNGREWPSADSKAPGGKVSATAEPERFGDSEREFKLRKQRRKILKSFHTSLHWRVKD